MLPFLSNLYSFKGACHRLTHYASSVHSFPHSLTKNNLAQLVLGEPSAYPADIEGLYWVADRLYKIFSNLDKSPGNSQMLNHLSNAAAGMTYKKLKATIPPDNGSFRSFWNIPEDLLTSMMVENDSVVSHPFPQSLNDKTLINLESWKNLWLLDCQSSLEHPFLIPVPPSEIFGEGITYRKFSTWKEGDHFSGSERFVIVVLDQENRTVGYISWYFWGCINEIKGTGLSFSYLSDDSLELYFSFDLRPCNSMIGLTHTQTIPSSFETFQESVDMYLESDLSQPA